MNEKNLPDEVRRFVLTSVPSVPYLEALLLLRSESATHWDAQSVARRLYVPEHQASELLKALEDSAIVQREAGSRATYLYRPAGEELGQVIDAVAAAYARNLVAVTDLIHSRVDRRAHHFAAAFRLKKEGS